MSKAVNTKWKKTFPDTIGNQNRPAEGVDDTQPFETGAFPQYMANDPVRYDLQNAAMSQSMSNDARLKEMVDARGKELDDHKVDPGAHKTGIAGNAATATKVVTTAASGASANIAEATMGVSDFARIRVSGASDAGELAIETADNGTEPIVARQYTGTSFNTVVRTAAILDGAGNTSFPGTVVAPKFTGTLNGNAATASKLLTPRTISLTGKAAGSTTFDGSANASINVTSVNADTASKLSTARKINITGNASGAANFDGSGDANISVTVNESKHAVNADTATHANDVTDAAIRYGVSGTDEKFTAMASGVIGTLKAQTGSDDLTSMNKLRSFVGSVNANSNWYDVISVRHRNGAADGPNFGLLMYSGLTNTDSIKYKKQPGSSGWTEERTILDSSNYNSYAPTKTGAGASGNWNINAATATKLQTPRTISLTGNASGSANFDGSGNVSINTTVSNSAAANALNSDTYRPADANVQYGDGKIRYFLATSSMTSNKPMKDAAILHLAWDNNSGFDTQLAITNINADLQTRSQEHGTWGDWKTFLNEKNYTNYAPTKDGVGASGTWPISISGNADKLDGYHASDLFRHLGGNQTPVITDIFDRAGTIDLSAMSAADKATAKANINKAKNSLQNIWVPSYGIYAYGGDLGMANGFNAGSIKLTQSYKNFDKILIVGTSDDGTVLTYKLWDVWELSYAFANSSRFYLFSTDSMYWFIWGTTRKGTTTNALSTDTIWNSANQNCGLVAIYGIKY